MKKLMFIAAFGLLVMFVNVAQSNAQEAKPADGKAIFEANKCMSCHAVKNIGIEAKKAEGEEAEENKAPDLSGVGLEKDAEFIAKYLQKLEAINGKKHMKKFKGTEDELKTLAAWLAEQKTKQ